MPSYKIEDYYITADSREIAEKILKIVKENNDSNRLIIILIGDEKHIIKIPDNVPAKIFSKSGCSITYCGKTQAGSGYQIIQSAIANFEIQQKLIRKISSATRNSNIQKSKEERIKLISDFESKIPEIGKSMWRDILSRIGATTDAYILEIIDSINESNVTINGRNLIPAFVWFRDKVLNSEDSLPIHEKKTHHMLRKTFITSIIRIAKSDAQHMSTMRLVMEENRGDDFWVKYGEK